MHGQNHIIDWILYFRRFIVDCNRHWNV